MLLTLGSAAIDGAFAALLCAIGMYIYAVRQPQLPLTKVARGAFCVALGLIVFAATVLGCLLVGHHFEAKYVYEHTARGMSKLYWLPSFWAGQEGSFLLWAFWISILGVPLAFTAKRLEQRVMPVYGSVLLFLLTLLLIRSPFLPLDLHGEGVPPDGLGLNPNLENPWMVIHPPTLFLGFAFLVIPFSYGMVSLIWRDRDEWLKRATPWALGGISVLGLAMMMGGYWAYEMLGWGGFWGWDPVENGPLIPWLCLTAFSHAASLYRVRKSSLRLCSVFALLPFVMSLYETFLTRTGVLEKFSVHSFSTLGGTANAVLLWALLGTVAVSVGLLTWRWKWIGSGPAPASGLVTRENAIKFAVLLLSLTAVISCLGMSAPLLTTLGVKLHLVPNVASVKEDFYNKGTYPLAVLLAVGLAVGPYLAWRTLEKRGMEQLVLAYGLAVTGGVAYLGCCHWLGTALSGFSLLAQFVLFVSSVFAVIANAMLARLVFFPAHGVRRPAATVGGHLAHVGAGLILCGIACLVTFVEKNPDVLLVQGRPQSVLNNAYTMTYIGQTSDYHTDPTNALRFKVVSADARHSFEARLPYALRSVEGGGKQLFAHPAIVHQVAMDVYFALKNGPDLYYNTKVFHLKLGLHKKAHLGDYDLEFLAFQRDPAAVLEMQQTGNVPEVFPIGALVKVTYKGKTTLVTPQSITHRDDPAGPDSPEVPLPGGFLLSFDHMNAGGTDMSQNSAGAESGEFMLRPNTGPPRPAYELEVSTRPMINLVWIGTLVLVLGGLLSALRRGREVGTSGSVVSGSAMDGVSGDVMAPDEDLVGIGHRH